MSNHRESRRTLRPISFFWLVALVSIICSSLSESSLGDESATASVKISETVIRLQRTVRKQGYSPDREGLQRYFAALTPRDDDVREIDELIEALGSVRYQVRELASKELLKAATTRPQLVSQRLRRVLDSDDEEVRFRAHWLLYRTSDAGDELNDAVLRLVHEQPVTGLLAALPNAWPHCTTDYQRGLFATALRSTALAEDQAALLRWIDKPSDFVEAKTEQVIPLEVAAIEALRAELGEQSLPLLEPRLKHAHDRARLAIAIAIIDFVPLPAIETLIELLASDDLTVRTQAASALRTVSGKNYKFESYSPRAERVAATKRWQEWFQRDAPDTEFMLPLDLTPQRQQRLVFSMFNPSKVVVCTLDGKVIRDSAEPKTPSACVLRPNGNLVAAEWGSNALCEIDPGGKMIKRRPLGTNPNGLELLPNGNLLVALFSENKVVEVDMAGKTIWEKANLRSPTDVHHLPNGNTLVALHGANSLVELNAKHDIVWSVSGISSPESARQLPNGNLLVANGSGVYEYDRDGKVVWQAAHRRAAYDAVLLDNGNILIADRRSGVFEYTRAGKKVRQLIEGTVRRIHYY